MQGLKSYAPYGALVASVAFLGLSFVATRAIMAHDDAPASLGMMRYGLAALVMLPFFSWRSLLIIRSSDLLQIILLGLLQFGLFHLCVNTALQDIPASRGAVIFALIPILTMAIAVMAGRDHFSWIKAFAALLAFSGVALAVGEKAFGSDVSQGWRGELLFFLAVCCGATYNALFTRLLQGYSVAALTCLAMFSGAFFLLPFAAAENLFTEGLDYSPADWGWFLYLSLVAGAASMMLFNWGLARLSPVRAAVFVPLSPIFAAISGWLVLDENLSGLFLVGLACAVAGPTLANLAQFNRK